jgi:hypothetical protein
VAPTEHPLALAGVVEPLVVSAAAVGGADAPWPRVRLTWRHAHAAVVQAVHEALLDRLARLLERVPLSHADSTVAAPYRAAAALAAGTGAGTGTGALTRDAAVWVLPTAALPSTTRDDDANRMD